MNSYVAERYSEFLSSDDLMWLFRYLEKECGSVAKAAEACDIERKTYYDWKKTNYLKLQTKRKVLAAVLRDSPDETLSFIMKRLIAAARELALTHLSTVYEMAAKVDQKEKFLALAKRFDDLRKQYSGLVIGQTDMEVSGLASQLVAVAESLGSEWVPKTPDLIEIKKLERIIRMISQGLVGNEDASKNALLALQLGVPKSLLDALPRPNREVSITATTLPLYYRKITSLQDPLNQKTLPGVMSQQLGHLATSHWIYKDSQGTEDALIAEKVYTPRWRLLTPEPYQTTTRQQVQSPSRA